MIHFYFYNQPCIAKRYSEYVKENKNSVFGKLVIANYILLLTYTFEVFLVSPEKCLVGTGTKVDTEKIVGKIEFKSKNKLLP